MSNIHIKQAYLRYDQETIFSDLHLKLPAGKWISLLGQSGVGKSSLLKYIANILAEKNTHMSGQVAADDNSEVLKNIAYLPQEDALLPWLSVIDNVLLGARLRGEVADVEKATHLLKEVGLGDMLKKRPAQLSGGQRQRVALVRTLLEDKDLVLMDEPFAALDVITRIKLQTLAGQLLKHKTVLLVTHDPLEALRLSDIIYVLSGKPARLSAPIIPDHPAPRDVSDPEVLAWQAKLLKELTGE